MARSPKRLVGPVAIATGPATVYTTPAGGALIRQLHVLNQTGSPATFTLSIGTDATGTRLYKDYSLGANTEADFWEYMPLADSEVVQLASGTNNALIITIGGDLVSASGSGLVAEGRSKNTFDTALCLPGVAMIGRATAVLTADVTYYGPFILQTQVTADRIAAEVTSAGAAGKVIRMGIYNADFDWQPTTLVVDGGTIAADSATVQTVTISQVLVPGRYLLALNSNGTPTVRSIQGGNLMGLQSTLSAFPFFSRAARALEAIAATAFPNPGNAWSNYTGSAVGFDYYNFIRLTTP